MRRFFAYVALVFATTPLFLAWSRNQVEAQLDEMQDDAFDTPGVPAPVPAAVFLAGGALLLAQVAAARAIRLTFWRALLGFTLGFGAGFAFFVRVMNRNQL